MDDKDIRRLQVRAEEMAAHDGPQALHTVDLLRQMKEDAADLFRLEIQLAKAETRQDIARELDLARGVAVAAICGVLGANMLIVAAVLAWAPNFAALASLIVGVVLLIIGAVAAFIGMLQAKEPLTMTRDSLKEDIEWAKEQVS